MNVQKRHIHGADWLKRYKQLCVTTLRSVSKIRFVKSTISPLETSAFTSKSTISSSHPRATAVFTLMPLQWEPIIYIIQLCIWLKLNKSCKYRDNLRSRQIAVRVKTPVPNTNHNTSVHNRVYGFVIPSARVTVRKIVGSGVNRFKAFSR